MWYNDRMLLNGTDYLAIALFFALMFGLRFNSLLFRLFGRDLPVFFQGLLFFI